MQLSCHTGVIAVKKAHGHMMHMLYMNLVLLIQSMTSHTAYYSKSKHEVP